MWLSYRFRFCRSSWHQRANSLGPLSLQRKAQLERNNPSKNIVPIIICIMKAMNKILIIGALVAQSVEGGGGEHRLSASASASARCTRLDACKPWHHVEMLNLKPHLTLILSSLYHRWCWDMQWTICSLDQSIPLCGKFKAHQMHLRMHNEFLH